MTEQLKEALAGLDSIEKLLPSLTGGLLLTECSLKCRSIRAALESTQREADALTAIEALLDDDCDETRVALYNQRVTVAAIRKVLDARAEMAK